jgi:hypothetical protein
MIAKYIIDLTIDYIKKYDDSLRRFLYILGNVDYSNKQVPYLIAAAVTPEIIFFSPQMS